MSEGEPARVLVVDDEPELRELLVDALASGQYHVETASSAAEAIDRVRRATPDIVIMDLRLGDEMGPRVVDQIRSVAGDVPAVFITGCGQREELTDASRRRPVEVMAKPLDLDRLRETIRRELDRRDSASLRMSRAKRLRRLARNSNLRLKNAKREMQKTCSNLAAAYRALGGQMSIQKHVIDFQRNLIACRNDDDVFRALFGLFVRDSGPIFGVAMVCNHDAQLRIVGRFGVPKPDSLAFCEKLAAPMVDAVLTDPQPALIDAGQEAELFDVSIRRYLVGVSILAIPLLPSAGEMIGLVLLYRKGEQPFTDGDIAMGHLMSHSTAVAIRKND